MNKQELIKLSSSFIDLVTTDELVQGLKRFLESNEIKKLKPCIDIPYTKFESFLRQHRHGYLLNDKCLNKSRIGRNIRSWYNSEQEIHKLPNEVTSYLSNFLVRDDAASLRLADTFFAQVIDKASLLKNKQRRQRDYAIKSRVPSHTVLSLPYSYIEMRDFVVLPNNTIAIAIDKNDSLFREFFPTKGIGQIRIYDMETNKEIKRLEYTYDENNKSLITTLQISLSNHLIGESNTHSYLWDINNWKPIKKCEHKYKDPDFNFNPKNGLSNKYRAEWNKNCLSIYDENRKMNTIEIVDNQRHIICRQVQFLQSGSIAVALSDFQAGSGPHISIWVDILSFPELNLQQQMNMSEPSTIDTTLQSSRKYGN